MGQGEVFILCAQHHPPLTRVPPAPHVLFTHILPVPTQARRSSGSPARSLLCAHFRGTHTRKNTFPPPSPPLPALYGSPAPRSQSSPRRPEWCVSRACGLRVCCRETCAGRPHGRRHKGRRCPSLSLKGLRARRPPHSPVPPSPFARAQVKRVGKYEIGKTLGEGTFGKVKYAVNTETGEKVRITEVLGDSLPRARRTHTPGLTSAPPSPVRAGGHQDPGQGEDPEAEHGRADQEGGEEGREAPPGPAQATPHRRATPHACAALRRAEPLVPCRFPS